MIEKEEYTLVLDFLINLNYSNPQLSYGLENWIY
jgi:hypothetical protein